MIEKAKTLGKAAQSLTDWKPESLTPEEWIRQLDAGKTIVTGEMVKDADGKYHHRKHLWKGTLFICTDADVIRGVDYDKHGIDEHPEGLEPFIDEGYLIERYPSLEREAFAIGHSISSLSSAKPPPHVRARISFLTERQIKPSEYEPFLLGVSIMYPIISASRHPAQPVFGNASKRRMVKDGELIFENEPFTTKILGNVLPRNSVDYYVGLGKLHIENNQKGAVSSKAAKAAKARQTQQPPTKEIEYDGNLSDWLAKHDVTIHALRHGPYQGGTAEMLLVTCPWEVEHTQAFGAKDTASESSVGVDKSACASPNFLTCSASNFLPNFALGASPTLKMG